MRLPIKINPDPVLEAVAEIRFDSFYPDEAVFGIIFNLFKEQYRDLTQLPILQMPKIVRSGDPKLIYQPHFRLSSEKYILQIGPKICSLGIKNKYYGWSEFLAEIVSAFGQIRDNKIIKNLKRLAIRYIDFFEVDIFQNIKLEIKIDSEDIIKNQTYFKNMIIDNPYQLFVQIGKDVSVRKGSKKYIGSVFDVDTQLINVSNDSLNNLKEIFDYAHEKEKVYFFSLLKPEFIAKLNPEYEK